MKHLEVSRVFQTVNTCDRQFAARKVCSIHCNGLLDPLIGFDHFELTTDVFGPHPHAGMSAVGYLFSHLNLQTPRVMRGFICLNFFSFQK
jgi:hypothetical protein